MHEDNNRRSRSQSAHCGQQIDPSRFQVKTGSEKSRKIDIYRVPPGAKVPEEVIAVDETQVQGVPKCSGKEAPQDCSRCERCANNSAISLLLAEDSNQLHRHYLLVARSR
jgi:hypothetical protein